MGTELERTYVVKNAFSDRASVLARIDRSEFPNPINTDVVKITILKKGLS